MTSPPPPLITGHTPTGQAPTGQEPWLAVNLSLIFPGLGQCWMGNVERGLLIGLIWSLLLVGGLGLLLSDLPRGALFGVVGLAIEPLFRLWSLLDAYRMTRQSNSLEFEAVRGKTLDPWLAVFWTNVLPGLGHLYIRKRLLGFVLLGLSVVGLAVPDVRLLQWFLFKPMMAWHAYINTPAKRSVTVSKFAFVQVAMVTMLPFILFVVLQLGTTTIANLNVRVTSTAMLPTLDVEEAVVVNRWQYQRLAPRRGDIVAYRLLALPRTPQRLSPPMIKRVIGLPGETVALQGGQVLINGRPLSEPYLLKPPTLEWGPETVPEGRYLLLGDNRQELGDRAAANFVPQEKIIGKVTQRTSPWSRLGPVQ